MHESTGELPLPVLFNADFRERFDLLVIIFCLVS
jgi:hypothetical protein